jgi:hypothetical protein
LLQHGPTAEEFGERLVLHEDRIAQSEDFSGYRPTGDVGSSEGSPDEIVRCVMH